MIGDGKGSAVEKIVLGLGGTVDYEIEWDSAVLEGLVEQLGIRNAELDSTVPVDSERTLVVTLLAFLKHGAGGERFIASSDLVETFAARFQKRITLGGTCVRAALGMRVLEVPCTLHLVSIDDHVRRLLPEGVEYLCSADHDTTDPHLIVQYPQGATVRAGDIDLVAPHPNRIIYANDPPNRELVLADGLGATLAKAEVFMVSGFNVIQDAGTLTARLAQLGEHMRRLPPGAIVFYEDAGYHVPALSRRVLDALVGAVDVHSMNEDELQAYLGRRLDLLDPEEMAIALRESHSEIPAPVLVVHTKYWALAIGDRAPEYAAALLGGVTMAGTRYRHGDVWDRGDYDAVAALPPHPGGFAFGEVLERLLGEKVVIVPAFAIPVDRPTTIGLGDTFVGGFVAALAS